MKFCDYCGKKLEPGDKAVLFMRHTYCSHECLHKDIDFFATDCVIKKGKECLSES